MRIVGDRRPRGSRITILAENPLLTYRALTRHPERPPTASEKGGSESRTTGKAPYDGLHGRSGFSGEKRAPSHRPAPGGAVKCRLDDPQASLFVETADQFVVEGSRGGDNDPLALPVELIPQPEDGRPSVVEIPAFARRKRHELDVARYIEFRVLPLVQDGVERRELGKCLAALRSCRTHGQVFANPGVGGNALIAIFDEKCGRVRLCENEAASRSKRLGKHYTRAALYLLERWPTAEIQMWTLSPPNVPLGSLRDGLVDICARVRNGIRSVRGRMHALVSVEVVRSPLDDWNVHVHLLVLKHGRIDYTRVREWFPDARVSAEFVREREMVRLERHRIARRGGLQPENVPRGTLIASALRETIKYFTKPTSMVGWPGEDWLEWWRATRGRRMFSPYGAFHASHKIDSSLVVAAKPATVGARVKRLRERAGLSQFALAEKMAALEPGVFVSRELVALVETEKGRPRTGAAARARLVSALGLEHDEVFRSRGASVYDLLPAPAIANLDGWTHVGTIRWIGDAYDVVLIQELKSTGRRPPERVSTVLDRMHPGRDPPNCMFIQVSTPC